MVDTNRSLLKYIVFSIFTCGIYGLYFIYALARDLNAVCDGDGEETSGLVQFIFFSIITCGIYTFYWYYKVGNRIHANAPRFNRLVDENGTTVLLWMVIGQLLCGIATIYADYIIIKNMNTLTRAAVGQE